VLVAGSGAVCVDGVAQRDPALEGAVVDLHVVVAAGSTRAVAAAPAAGEDEDAFDDGDLDVGRVDAGELDHEIQSRRILGPEDVNARPKACPADAEAGLAEVGEELLHLGLDAIGVPARRHATIVAVGRLLRIAGLGLALLLYVWFGAVRNARAVRARKAARRATGSS
jgi:hypothetical protein